MLTPVLLMMVVALFITMLVVRYKKILATNEVDVGLFVGLGNDIIRESGLSFPKNRLEIPEFTKRIVAQNRYKNGYDCSVINNPYVGVELIRARSPTQFNEIGSWSRC